MNKDNLIEYAKEQIVVFPEDSAIGWYLRKTLKMLQAEPCEDAISREKIEKLKRWRLPYDTNTTIPKSDLFVKLTDIRDLPSVTPVACIAKVNFSKEDMQEIVDKKVEEITVEPRWIPVSERLPEPNRAVLTYVNTGKSETFCLANWNDACGDWEEWIGTRMLESEMEYKVLAWMPLPKPYQAEKESEE